MEYLVKVKAIGYSAELSYSSAKKAVSTKTIVANNNAECYAKILNTFMDYDYDIENGKVFDLGDELIEDDLKEILLMERDDREYEIIYVKNITSNIELINYENYIDNDDEYYVNKEDDFDEDDDDFDEDEDDEDFDDEDDEDFDEDDDY